MKTALVVVWAAAAVAGAELGHVRAFLAHSEHAPRRRYRPRYHVTAPLGWLNDPAALVFFRDAYHLFYQYYPYDGVWSPLHWGHAASADLVHWTHYPAALLPREPYDRHGCLAGSALVYNDHLALYYTGEEIVGNDTRQTQNVALSSDGVIFQKYLYNPVVRAPPAGVADFRNPKVWRMQHSWYMLAGASAGGRGRLELYSARDLYGWRHRATVARSYGDLGHLWESPDVFEVDGVSVLVLSVRGVPADGFRFRNLHQTGYVLGTFDYRGARFADLEVSTATFSELDHGHDYYAAKSTRAADGRRVLVAWLGMWESEFPEADEGWAGALALAREVRLGEHGRLLTPPVREAAELRAETLEDAWYSPGEAFAAGTRCFELVVNASSAAQDAALSLEWEGRARYSVRYAAAARYVAVDRGGADGERRADWPRGAAAAPGLHWRLFVDRSSVELFVGEGELAFSSRVYPRRGITVRVGGAAQLHVVQYRLRASVGYDAGLRNYLQKYVLHKNDSPGVV